MKYGFSFLLLGGFLAWCGIQSGHWNRFLLWPALSFWVVAAGYSGLGAQVFGKRPDGTISWYALVPLLPYFLYTWGVWHLLRFVRHEDCYNEVTQGLYLGRRAHARELPPDVQAVVDLTAEFSESAAVRRGREYLSLPILDASVPKDARFRELVDKVARLPRPVYVHCAEGHGRSAAVVAALLLRTEQASTVEEAISIVRQARPGVRLIRKQRELLRRVCRGPRTGCGNAPGRR